VVAAAPLDPPLEQQVESISASARLVVPQVVIPAPAMSSEQSDPLGIGSMQDFGDAPTVVAPTEVYSTFLPTTEAASEFDSWRAPSVATPDQQQQASNIAPFIGADIAGGSG
jgi:hypothetical protein